MNIGSENNVDINSPSITISKIGNNKNYNTDFGGVCSNGELTINSGLINISASNNETGYYSAGIKTNGGATINNGTINAMGVKYGLYSLNSGVTINDGDLDFQSMDETLWWQYGVYCRGVSLIIKGGNINAFGRGKCSRGLFRAPTYSTRHQFSCILI